MERKTKYFVTIVVVVIIAGGTSTVILPWIFPAPQQLKIGILTPASINDFGWNYEMFTSANWLDSQYEDVTIDVFTDLGWGSDTIQPVAIDLLAEGYQVIVAHTSGDFWGEVAVDWPDRIFLSAGNPPDNINNTYGYGVLYSECAYVFGFIAASISQSQKIGYMDGFPWGSTKAIANAFYEGAKTVNDTIDLSVVWANTWEDVELAQSQAQTLINQGIDNIMVRTSAYGAIQAAGNNSGTIIYGSEIDQKDLGPTFYMASAAANHSRLLQYLIEVWHASGLAYPGDISIGVRGSGAVYFGMADQGSFIIWNDALLSNTSIVPAQVKTDALAFEADIIAGSVVVAYNETQTWP